MSPPFGDLTLAITPPGATEKRASASYIATASVSVASCASVKYSCSASKSESRRPCGSSAYCSAYPTAARCASVRSSAVGRDRARSAAARRCAPGTRRGSTSSTPPSARPSSSSPKRAYAFGRRPKTRSSGGRAGGFFAQPGHSAAPRLSAERREQHRRARRARRRRAPRGCGRTCGRCAPRPVPSGRATASGRGAAPATRTPASIVGRADDDRLDRREPDGQHRGAVQRAPQLAQRVQAVQRERLDVLGFVERPPPGEHRRAGDRRRVHDAPEQRGDGRPVDLVGKVRHRPRVPDRRPLACGLHRGITAAERSHASCTTPRREEHERGDDDVGVHVAEHAAAARRRRSRAPSKPSSAPRA